MLAVVATAAVMLGTAGSAGARSTQNWVEIHVHLNAYAHWGHCSKFSGTTTPTSDDHRAQCYGKQGGEVGVIGGREHFLHHGSECRWTWDGNTLTVFGTDVHGGRWELKGVKDSGWTQF